MKERPIKFNADMVRALLDGRKTMTRRVINPQPQPNGGAGLHPVEPYNTSTGDWNWVLAATGHGTGDPFPCPYGQPGDLLWVKEQFRFHVIFDELSPEDAGAKLVSIGYALPWCPTQYEADETPTRRMDWFLTPVAVPFPGKLRLEREMPRWASRILLEIVSVRVERLQDISEADARAEGCEASGWMPSYSNPDNAGCHESRSATDAFSELWESIYGPGAWEKNPWVWVVEFKRIEAADFRQSSFATEV